MDKDPHKSEWEVIGGENIALSRSKDDIYWRRYESCQRLLDQI